MSAFDTCALCPRLCRAVCPVASVSEIGTPSVLAGLLRDHAAGRVSDDLARQAATACTSCGACEDHCALGRPLPALLAAVRDALGVAPIVLTLQPILGLAGPVVVEPDARPLAAAVSRRLRKPVSSWRTDDFLGADVLGHRAEGAHLAAVRSAVGTRELWVVDGGSARVGAAAGLVVKWVDEVLLGTSGGAGSCGREGPKPFGCCGGAGALRSAHPDLALEVASLFFSRLDGAVVEDARCASFLSAVGNTHDPIGRWIGP